jgi:hypothetical protein
MGFGSSRQKTLEGEMARDSKWSDEFGKEECRFFLAAMDGVECPRTGGGGP